MMEIRLRKLSSNFFIQIIVSDFNGSYFLHVDHKSRENPGVAAWTLPHIRPSGTRHHSFQRKHTQSPSPRQPASAEETDTVADWRCEDNRKLWPCGRWRRRNAAARNPAGNQESAFLWESVCNLLCRCSWPTVWCSSWRKTRQWLNM